MQPKAMMVCTDGSEDARDAFYVKKSVFFEKTTFFKYFSKLLSF